MTKIKVLTPKKKVLSKTFSEVLFRIIVMNQMLKIALEVHFYATCVTDTFLFFLPTEKVEDTLITGLVSFFQNSKLIHSCACACPY